MSDLETAPVEFDCVAAPSGQVEILEPRDVPPGGPRAMRGAAHVAADLGAAPA